jgi:hypothetical protein
VKKSLWLLEVLKSRLLIFFIDHVETGNTAWLKFRAGIGAHVYASLSDRDTGLRRCTACNSNFLRRRVELSRSNLDLSLCSAVRLWSKYEVDRGDLQAKNITVEGRNRNVRVRLRHLNHVFEVHWAVTFDLKLLVVGIAYGQVRAHLDEFGEQVVNFRVDDWEGVDGDENFVALAVDPERVVVVLVLVDGRGELDVDFFGHARWDHALLVVADFEEARLRGQNVQPLRRWRIIYQFQLHRVRFVRFEARELDHRGRRLEDAVRAHSVVGELLGN